MVLYTQKDFSENRFMSKGVELQMDANSYWEAKKAYVYSCMLCTHTGATGGVKCAQCPIRGAFLENASIFEKKIPKQELEFVRKERELL